MTFEPWQWTLLIAAGLLVGFSKSGVPGIGILAVAIFQVLLPAKAATGMVLPLLIVGDVVAVATYRQHAEWRHVFRLFPWAAVGVFAGDFALGRVDDRQAAILIGVILIVMLALHVVRNRKSAAATIEHTVAEQGVWFGPFIGIMAGFTTQVANAAGPVMIIYLLAMRLPKMEFLGTGAVFFMLLNWFKVPFMIRRGMITTDSFGVNLWLSPAVVAGAIAGRAVAQRIPQKLFERVALILTFAAALKLLWGALFPR